MKKISHRHLLETIHYNPQTGIITRLKSATRSDRVGRPAGWLMNNGYVRICIGNFKCQAHILIWFYMTGRWPKADIDHRNTIRSDNRWVNLREATRKQNRANTVVSKNNKLRTKGVRKISKNRFNARLGQKSLGCFLTIEAASAAYAKAARKYYGEFARVR